jgi:hypothetical protein
MSYSRHEWSKLVDEEKKGVVIEFVAHVLVGWEERWQGSGNRVRRNAPRRSQKPAHRMERDAPDARAKVLKLMDWRLPVGDKVQWQ